MQTRHAWKVGLLFVVGTLLLAACGTGTAQPGTEKVRMGISPFQDTLLPIIGGQKGWFAQEGLDVQLTTLAWGDVMTAVASRSVDVAINNTTGVVSVVHVAPDVVYWYPYNPFDQGSALLARPSSGLKTVKDYEAAGMSHTDAVQAAFKQLKGRRIITALGTDMGKEVVSALQSVNLDYKSDVKIVDMDPDLGLAAFLSGTGDAYLGGIPQRTRAMKEGMVVIASGPDLAPPPINGFVTTKTYATSHQDSLLKLMHVMFRIIRYCDANRSDCGNAITTYLNQKTGSQMTVNDFTAFWQNWEHYDLNASAVQRDILDPSGYSYWKKTWDQDNSSLLQQKAIPGAAAPADFFWGAKIQQLYTAKYGSSETGF